MPRRCQKAIGFRVANLILRLCQIRQISVSNLAASKAGAYPLAGPGGLIDHPEHSPADLYGHIVAPPEHEALLQLGQCAELAAAVLQEELRVREPHLAVVPAHRYVRNLNIAVMSAAHCPVLVVVQ